MIDDGPWRYTHADGWVKAEPVKPVRSVTPDVAGRVAGAVLAVVIIAALTVVIGTAVVVGAVWAVRAMVGG
ncbi:MAG: hypothetical protein ACR2MN_14570 [Acidimicrobiales bacterium]